MVLFCIALGVALIGHKDKSLVVDNLKVFTDVFIILPMLIENSKHIFKHYQLEQIKQRGVLRVGYRSDRIPLSYRNNSHELIGLDIELVRYLANDLGVKLNFYPLEWKNKIDLLNLGEVDLLMGVAYDTPNLVIFELSLPYIDGHLGLVVKDYKRHKFATIA